MTFPDIFDIDVEGGLLIGVAILGLWAAAWSIRVIIRAILDTDEGRGA